MTRPNLASFRLLTVAKKRFLRTHEEVDHTPHPVVGLVLRLGDAENFHQALGFEILDRFCFSKQGPCFTAI